jgi:hypothetical protein
LVLKKKFEVSMFAAFFMIATNGKALARVGIESTNTDESTAV